MEVSVRGVEKSGEAEVEGRAEEDGGEERGSESSFHVLGVMMSTACRPHEVHVRDEAVEAQRGRGTCQGHTDGKEQSQAVNPCLPGVLRLAVDGPRRL